MCALRLLLLLQFRDIEAAKDNLKKDLRRDEVAKLKAVSTTDSVSVCA